MQTLAEGRTTPPSPALPLKGGEEGKTAPARFPRSSAMSAIPPDIALGFHWDSAGIAPGFHRDSNINRRHCGVDSAAPPPVKPRLADGQGSKSGCLLTKRLNKKTARNTSEDVLNNGWIHVRGHQDRRQAI